MLQNLPEECLYLILNKIEEPRYKDYNVSLSGLKHTKLFETLRFCKKTNYNFVFVHLLKLSIVCKQFKSYFDSHKLWIELAVRDIRKGVLYKRTPKTMKHRYLQRFVYFKALHEFSVNIRALEQDHHQYIVYLMRSLHIRKCTQQAMIDGKDIIYRQIEYHFWSRSGDTMYIQTNRVPQTDKGFTTKEALKHYDSCNHGIRMYKIYNGMYKYKFKTLRDFPFVKVLLGIMRCLGKRTKYIETLIDKLDCLYKETNLDNFKPYTLSNSHCVMYRFLER